MIGRTISHYTILSCLGEGGMGVVYEARDEKLNRLVALKFLGPELVREPTAKERFLREAQAAASLHHPNICPVFEIDEADGHTFIAMACIEGSTLKDKVDHGPLGLEEALEVAIQVCQGLGAAHRQGIVHRDIKSANIMITAAGQVQIMDFGLALSCGQSQLTRAGTQLGTAANMSPEQSRGEKVDHRADIWSCGVVLYEMVSGRLPFRGDYEQAIVYGILNEDPPPLTGQRTGVPPELERIVGKALAKLPENRYQHMDDLLVDLKAVREDLATETSSAARPAAGGTRTVRPAKRLRNSLAIFGGAVVGLLALGAVLFGLNVGNIRGLLSGNDEPGPIRSLAVLPFNNMMGDAEQDFFVEGMHETLITELSRIGDLRVISRTSAMHFQKSGKSLPEIAKELDVDALVEGSVLRVGERVRITAQLIRGATDEHLWADDYDRDLRDVLNLIREVAREIAGEIDIALTPGQQERLAADRTIDPAVYELFLQGRHHLNRFSVADAREASRYFQQAIDADPEFALAHAGLAGAYIIVGVVGDVPPAEAYLPAREADLRALALEPDLPEAHIGLGYVALYYDLDWNAAERAFRLALEVDPHAGDALHGVADCLTVQGRFDEALDLTKQARQTDPYSHLRNLPVFSHLLLCRRYEEAIAEIEQWRAFTGDPASGFYVLRQVYLALGRHDQAMAEQRHSPLMQNPELAAAMEQAFAESGIQAALRTCAEFLVDQSQNRYIDPLDVAVYFALAGEAEDTFVWLEETVERRSSLLHTIAIPALDPFRADPRFQDLMRRMEIPEPGWRLGPATAD